MTIATVKSLLKIPSAKLSLFEVFLLGAPIAVWFSYRPLFSLGKNASTNFELSITVIYLVILALLGLPSVWRNKVNLSKKLPVQVSSLFIAISGLSLLWTPNLSRGVLTIGMMGVVYLLFLAGLAGATKVKLLTPTLTNILITSAVIMSFISLIQVIAAIWLTRQQTLLCGGCAVTQFGFARPNVFTIEPQFFGNLLLAPLVILTYKLLQNKQKIHVTFAALSITFALFLTLSRGAIFAFGAALIILVITMRPTIQRMVCTGLILLISFAACIVTQGMAAAVNSAIDTSFKKAASASINQMSMGVIKIPIKETPKATPMPTKPVVASEPVTPSQPIKAATKITPNYSGYVPVSTNARRTLTKLAIQSWQKTPSRILFGVGVGGAGVVLRNDFPDLVNAGEIVQNEYIEVLLENGLVGITVFVGLIGMLFWSTREQKWLWAIIGSFLIQWNFFSGYPNALHMYLTLIVIYISREISSKSKIKSSPS